MITHTYSGHILRIYIDKVLYMSIPEWFAIQSWMDEGQYPYKIEFYFKEADPILAEYDTREKWIVILDILDRVERMAW